MLKLYSKFNQTNSQNAQNAWGSRGERVRAMRLAACCNYFSKKKKISKYQYKSK